ncbi:hypothetical protein Tco_0153271 [Tanacetum coccineum]
MIFGRQVNRVHILDFEGLTPDMRQDLAERMRMVYIGDDGQEYDLETVYSSSRITYCEEMAEDEFGAYWLGSERLIPDKGDLSDYWIKIYSGRDFLRGGRHLKRYDKGRNSGAQLTRGHFVWRLAHHFTLVSDDGLRGLSVVACELPLIDMGELVKLNICREIGDDWAWVALGPERQQVAMAGAPEAVKDALVVDEGALADPASIQAPQSPPPPPAAGRTMPQRLGRLEEEIQGLRKDVGSLRGLVERSMTDQGRVFTWMISCMTQLMEASGQTYQAFDGTFRAPAIFERRTRQRTGEASTFAAPQQPDP